MTHIDLFSGIGGFALAAQWAGFKTIVFCEIDEFCQEILKTRFGAIADTLISISGRKDNKNTNNKRRGKSQIGSKSIQSQNKEAYSNNIKSSNPILISNIRDFDGTKWRGATLLTGGFPCQPFSVAGQRRGKEDDRYLWSEMLHVIKEAKPHWILAENVSGIFRMALDEVLADLEGEGYSTGTLIIPACGLNAPHRRNRIWIVAYDNNSGNRTFTSRFNDNEKTQDKEEDDFSQFGISRSDSNASDTSNEGLQRNKQPKTFRERAWPSRSASEFFGWQENWIEVATRFCRMDDGIPNRVDRLKALGNAIVPQIAYEIMTKIRIIEENK